MSIISRLLLLLVFVVVLSSFVSAQVVLSPNPLSFTTYRSVPLAVPFSVFNNNSFPIFNLSFSNVSDMTFPIVGSLLPGESRNMFLTVSSSSLYSQQFFSDLSFFFDDVVSCNLSSRVFVVNVSDTGGFSVGNVSLFVNDSVLFFNVGNVSVDVKDFSSSNVLVSVPPGGQSSLVFVSNLSVYLSPNNYGGSLFVGSVSSRPLSCRITQSSLYPRLFLNVNSVLSPTTLQFVNIIPSSFSSNNNQTQFGSVFVKNNDNLPLYNVVLSDSRGWVSFSQNNFTLNGLENRQVNFNLTPYVSFTNLTNVSLPLEFRAYSSNGGNGSILSTVFIAYMNLDNVSSGSVIVVNRLSINDSIVFCMAHPEDVECVALVNRFKSNFTVVSEVPATHVVTESRWLDIDKKIDQAFAGQDRVENSANRLITYVQNDSLPLMVGLASDVKSLKTRQDNYEFLMSKMLDDGVKRFNFWLWFGGSWLFLGVSLYFYRLYRQFEFRKGAKQW